MKTIIGETILELDFQKKFIKTYMLCVVYKNKLNYWMLDYYIDHLILFHLV